MSNNIAYTIRVKQLKNCALNYPILNVDDTVAAVNELDNKLSDINLDVGKALSSQTYLLSAMTEIFGRFGAHVH